MRRRASIVAWVEGVDVTVAELFPAFTRELQSLAVQEGRADLAEQIPDLPVVARCKCGEDNCAHFYTAPPPSAAYGLAIRACHFRRSLVWSSST